MFMIVATIVFRLIASALAIVAGLLMLRLSRRRKTLRRVTRIAFRGLLLYLVVSFALVVDHRIREYRGSPDFTSLSPDGCHQVCILRRNPGYLLGSPVRFDVKIGLAELDHRELPLIDRIDPYGRRTWVRGVWSKDGSYCLILEHDQEYRPSEGSLHTASEELVLLHHVPTRRTWHRYGSIVQGEPLPGQSEYESLTREVVKSIAFVERIELVEGAPNDVENP